MLWTGSASYTGEWEKVTQGKGLLMVMDGRSTKEQASPTAQARFRPLLASHLLTCHWVNSEPRGRKVYRVFCGRHSKDT